MTASTDRRAGPALRRGGRSSGWGTRKSADSVIAALQPRHWYRADTFTLSGGNLATLPNRNMVVGGAMAVSSGTIAAPTADATLGGAQSIVFRSSSPNGLQSTLPATDFTYLHDGSGEETWAVFVPTESGAKTIWTTKAFAAVAEIGIGQFHNTATPQVQQVIGNGSATNVSIVGAAGSAVNEAAYATSVYRENAPIEVLASFKDSYVSTPATAVAPSTSAPQSTLRIGRSSLDTVPGGMRFAEFLSFNRVLSSYERQQVREYIQSRYGIAAPVWSAEDRQILQLNPFSWIRADYYATSGGKVTAFLDKVLPGHSLTQGTVANQVVDPVAVAAWNSKLAAGFTGAQIYASSLPVAGWSFLSDGSGCEVYAPARLLATGTRAIFGTTSAGNVTGLSTYAHTGGNFVVDLWKTGGAVISARAYGAATLNQPFILRIQHGSATPNFRFKSTGNTEVTGNYSSAVGSGAPGHSLQWGANTGPSAPWNGELPEHLTFARRLSAAEQSIVSAYYLSRYGVAA